MDYGLNMLYKKIPHYHGSLLFFKDKKKGEVIVHISSFRRFGSFSRKKQLIRDLYEFLSELSRTSYKDVIMESHLINPSDHAKMQEKLSPLGIKIMSFIPRRTPKFEAFTISILSYLKLDPVKVNMDGGKIHLRLP